MAIMVPVFLLFLACCDVRAVLLLRGGERLCCIRGRWSLGLQRTNLSEGFGTKKRPEIRRWFLRFILSWVSYFSSDFEGYIRRNRYLFNKVYWEAVKI